MAAVDDVKLSAFLGRFAADLGATAHAAMVLLGHRLSLDKALDRQLPTAAAAPARTEGWAMEPVKVAAVQASSMPCRQQASSRA